MNKKIKILIVDDSRIFRSALAQCLADADDIMIIGSVFSGVKALEFIQKQRPDIVTLDVEMSGMDGLATLDAIRKINAATPELRPIGVIMLSIFTEKGADTTIKALEAGAFDFIAKPRAPDAYEGIRTIRRQLLVKIRHYASRVIIPHSPGPGAPITTPVTPKHHLSVSSIRAILIGSSTGGPKALAEIMPALCEKLEIPIFIVQHMPSAFTGSLAKSLDNKCLHTVREGEDREIVRPRHVYIAPGGKHMLVREFNTGIGLVINDQPPEQGCRPSVNVLFRSAAAVYGSNAVAIVLTGMGSDGANGIEALKRAGAGIIAQDESTSVVWGMPKSAIDTGCVDKIIPVSQIPEAVVTFM